MKDKIIKINACQEPRIAKTNLKKNKVGGIKLPGFNTN